MGDLVDVVVALRWVLAAVGLLMAIALVGCHLDERRERSTS